MAISFGSKPKEEDVVSLIAAKKYARAIELLKAQVSKKGANPSLRMQLADVLILAEKKSEAISLLLPLADQYANEGFAAKAVSVLKKVQRIDPGRREVDARLARLIEERQREAVLPSSRPAPAFGMEEIGAESGPMLEIGFGAASISAPVEPMSRPVPGPDETLPVDSPFLAAPPMPPSRVKQAPVIAAPPEPELALPIPTVDLPPIAPPAFAPITVPAPPPVAPIAAPPPPAPRAKAPAAPLPPPLVVEPEPLPVLILEPEAVVALPVLEPELSPDNGSVEDYDLLYAGDDDDDDLGVTLEPEPPESAAPAAEAMSAGQFADELMSLVDSVFQEFPDTAPATPAAAKGPQPPRGGSQIVVSPLFRDFSVDEMVAVIEGLRLVTLERSDVILREGQPGGSLYMLTSGRVRAFKKDPGGGKQIAIGDLKEGAFFGEMSILTGQPRMASIVALTRCELLELDRPTLDRITATHPHVWDVLREFAEQRAALTRR